MSESERGKIRVLREVQRGDYLIQVFNYADTWLLDAPAPAEWDTLVYRVMKGVGGHEYPLHERQIPPSIAKMGDTLVRTEQAGQMRML